MSGNRTSTAYDYTKSIIVALILAFIIKTSIVEAYKIPSSSMEDTLLVGDFILANKFIYGARVPFTSWHLPALRNPEPGDVVIFRWPVDDQTNYIKRCVAKAGQTVEIRDKVLMVDGEISSDPEFAKFTDRKVFSALEDRRDNLAPFTIPAGHIFCMGDNRDNSYDSRFWGTVPLDKVEGEALIIHWSWSPDRQAPVIDLSDLLSIPRAVVYNIVHFYQRVRWNRLGHPVD